MEPWYASSTMSSRAPGEVPCARRVLRGAWSRRGSLLLALVACREGQPAADPEPAPPAADPPAAPPPADVPSPPERRCGEAGELPTELPPALATGRSALGEVTVKPGETRTLGAVEVRYDRDVWIGTHRAGHRGPALLVQFPQAEADGGPYGAQHELHGGGEARLTVAPYRFDVRAGAGDPPESVTVAVTRETCPESAQIEPTTAPRSLWVSTEAIRQHTYDLHGELLQVFVDLHGDVPRLDVSRPDYRQWFEPRPGAPRSVRVAGHTITIDRVVPVPKTSSSNGGVHVRARIEPALAPSFPAPVAAPGPCGDAGPARTELPAGLAALPAEAERRILELGQKGSLGALNFEYLAHEVPARGGGPYRVEASSVSVLQLTGAPAIGGSVTGPFSGPRLVRRARELLRIEPARGGTPETIEVRRFALACPKEHVIGSAPAYLWLSTLGRGYVTAGEPADLLSLQIYEDPEQPSLGFGSAQAYFSRRIAPDLVGLVFTLDGWLVEIVDVLASDGSTHVEGRWRTDRAAPAVHVQLRLSRTT